MTGNPAQGAASNCFIAFIATVTTRRGKVYRRLFLRREGAVRWAAKAEQLGGSAEVAPVTVLPQAIA